MTPKRKCRNPAFAYGTDGGTFEGFIGFTAATGGDVDEHEVHGFEIVQR